MVQVGCVSGSSVVEVSVQDLLMRCFRFVNRLLNCVLTVVWKAHCAH